MVIQTLFLLSQCSLPLFPPLYQSEHEKLLRRQKKKEEKKEEKKARKDHQVSSTIEDNTSHLKSLGFDPNELWRERLGNITYTVLHDGRLHLFLSSPFFTPSSPLFLLSFVPYLFPLILPYGL